MATSTGRRESFYAALAMVVAVIASNFAFQSLSPIWRAVLSGVTAGLTFGVGLWLQSRPSS